MLRTLFVLTILAGGLTGSALAQTPDAGCALPSVPKGIPAAIDKPRAASTAFKRSKKLAAGA